MAQVRVGEYADIHLAAYPSRTCERRELSATSMANRRIPTFAPRRSALQVENPGLMRIGMFVTATFHGGNGGAARDGALRCDSSSARS